MVYPESKREGEAEVSLFIEAKSDKVWKLLSDLEHPQAWDGLTRETAITSDSPRGKGCCRERTLNGGTRLREEVEHWIDRREYRLRWENANIPIRDVRMLARVIDAGRGRSVATLRLTYQARWWPLGQLADYLVIRPALTRMLKTNLENLGEACA